ncbi:glycerophosphodiester phosphodiesterase GDPD2-like [Henckelia pumila]|uniref:glycerophosphodiester phosphodiesterase GDPD2-like n=1 Tax=Henckelia pumila TaxID=405737 RepID=UPI003C6DE63C
MALKTVHVSHVPNNIDHASISLFSTGVEFGRISASSNFKAPKFLVIGHRGNGMNMLQSTDLRFCAVKENTILSFNTAANFPIDYIEFDVQVTKDGCPVIFHDNFLFSEDNGTLLEHRVTDLSLTDFLSYGPQKEHGVVGKSLLRKMKDGNVVDWNVESDDHLCTLQEAFEKVNPSLGFNIELKFDDNIVYEQEYLIHVLQAILRVIWDHAKERPILFSSFQPDAALLVRKLQSTYPVFFLTNGGNEVYSDVRRNSLEEAMNVCLEGGLQGIVSEVRGVFTNPGAVNKIKESKLYLLTYGKLNNVAEAVCMQHLMGVDGVIVDLIKEITESVSIMMTEIKGLSGALIPISPTN